MPPLDLVIGESARLTQGFIVFFCSYALVFLALFLVTIALLRKTVWSGSLAFALLPLASLFLGLGAWPLAGVSISVAVILIAHRENLFLEAAAQSACRSVQADSTQLPK